MTIFEGWSLTFNLPAKNVAGDSVFVKPIIKGAIDLYSYDGKMGIGSHQKGRFALSKKLRMRQKH